MKHTLAVIAVLFSFSSVRAQDSTRHWKNAIGVTGSGLSYLFGTDRLMIEPGIDFFFFSPNRYTSPSLDIGVYRWGAITPDMRWYAGPCIGATFVGWRNYDPYINQSSSWWDLSVRLSLVLGIEQRVSDHFSVGAETGAEWQLNNVAGNRHEDRNTALFLRRTLTGRYYF